MNKYPYSSKAKFVMFFETGALNLQDIGSIPDTLIYGETLPTHAIPSVNFLAQLVDRNIDRVKPVIAKFQPSGDSQFAEFLDYELTFAICDVTRAAGINVSFTHIADSSQLQLPQKFINMFVDV